VPAKLKPTKYRVDGCHSLCGINPRNLPAGLADLIHSWYEMGDNKVVLERKSVEFGHHISQGSFANHKRKHMVREDQFTPIADLGGDPELDSDEKLTDLQILDRIIQAGAKGLNSRSVRITPDMTLKAMELRLKLTQGSVHDDFMSAVAKAMGGGGDPEPPAPENPDAQTGDEEQAQAGAPDVDSE